MNKKAREPKDFWFTEGDLPYANQDVRISVKVTKKLYDKKSDYGHIEILDTPFFGRVLAIDGIINIAKDTEFIYHEMMVTLPCIYHGSPKSVLIIGGGDGGAAKHALGIKTIKKIVQVEIDKDVIDACQQYLPEISDGSLQNNKVELTIGDGLEYVKNTKNKFDVVVLDVSDPVPGGPAVGLLSTEFYKNVKKILNKDGVMLTHCGSLIFQAKKAKTIAERLEKIFKRVTMHVALIPEFELTEFGFLICSSGKKPLNTEIHNKYKTLLSRQCRYLSPEVYFSSAVLSPYIQKLTGVVNKD